MKGIIYIVTCLIISFLSVGVLFYFDKINKHKNDFKRSFLPPGHLQNKRVLDIQYNYYYIAGLSGNRIYLNNYVKPNKLLITDYNLTSSKSVELKIPDTQLRNAYNSKVSAKIVKATVDSSGFFLVDKLTHTLAHGILPELEYNYLKKISFNEAIALPPASFVIRTYDPKLQQSFLHKVSKYSGIQGYPSFVLEKQVDGFFCTNGTMLYNSDLSQIIYVYRYRNEFIGLDTMLNVLYRGNTIDTVSHAKIKTVTISSENRMILSPRPQDVSKYCSVFSQQLYINSGIMADNELKNHFNKNSVIDVYSLKNRKYQFSFYLPDHDNQPLHDFRVRNNKVIALYDHHIVTYDLDTRNFAHKLSKTLYR